MIANFVCMVIKNCALFGLVHLIFVVLELLQTGVKYLFMHNFSTCGTSDAVLVFMLLLLCILYCCFLALYYYLPIIISCIDQ